MLCLTHRIPEQSFVHAVMPGVEVFQSLELMWIERRQPAGPSQQFRDQRGKAAEGPDAALAGRVEVEACFSTLLLVGFMAGQ